MTVDLKSANASALRILIVAADPTSSSNEHLEEEVNVIREALGPNQKIQPGEEILGSGLAMTHQVG